MKNYAIILASGVGSRCGLDLPKQFLEIEGKTVFEHTVESFEINENIDSIIIVSHKDYIDLCEKLILKNNFKKIKKIIPGGQTRKDSSYAGVCSIEENEAKVLIHDSVRPFVSNKIINNCITALDKHDAVVAAVQSTDTILKINENNTIEEIPDRKVLYRAQTPQAFKLSIIKKAHESANKSNGIQVTDDCGLVIKFNLAPIYVVEGSDYNLKITYPADIAIANKLLQLKNNK